MRRTHPAIAPAHLAAAAACLFVVLCTGCGPQIGGALYVMGMVPPQKVPAEFKMPEGPMLILVDDDQELVQPPTVREMLVDALAKQFKEHKIADRVTKNDELAMVKQADPKFDTRGAREVGKAVGADTVVWINVQQYELEKDLEMAVAPAQLAVTVKVINAKAEKREDVRLWPLDREGRIVDTSIPPFKIHRAKTRNEVYEMLVDTLSDKIARLFYEFEVTQDNPDGAAVQPR